MTSHDILGILLGIQAGTTHNHGSPLKQSYAIKQPFEHEPTRQPATATYRATALQKNK